MPTLAVVIPTYNRTPELARALDSLLAQTWQDFEVVVCDDGSSEDVGAVVHRYENRLAIRCLRIPNSGGPARPRNVAVAASTAPWVSFLDSDDWWDPGRVARMLPHLGQDVDVVYHRLRQVVFPPATRAPSGELVGADCGPEPLRRMLTRGNPIPNSAAIVRRATLERLGGIAEDLNSVEDFDTWLRFAELGARFRFVPEVLGSYSVSQAGISTFGPRQYAIQRALFAKHLHLLPASLRPLAESHFNYLLGSYALRLGDPSTARRHLEEVRLDAGLARFGLALVKRAVAKVARPRLALTDEQRTP